MRTELAFATEAALCEAFLAEVRRVGGWTAYPETAGFDILLVSGDGHQIGIEAKLKLNEKVADQILPHEYSFTNGPDYRAVLVGCNRSGHALERLLGIVGIVTIRPSCGKRFRLDLPSERCRWHDWNPVRRCTLPSIVPDVPAGVPCPVQLTPWKIGALRVLADLETDGHVTAARVRAHGIDPRRFCSADGWLAPLGSGRWGPGPRLPRFQDQHPAVYASILAERKAAMPASLLQDA